MNEKKLNKAIRKGDRNRYKSYHYSAFGLGIKSDLEIPELSPIDDKAIHNEDIRISIGNIPPIRSSSTSDKVLNQTSSDFYFIEVINQARIEVRNGNSIVIHPLEKAPDWLSIRIFLLHTGIIAAVHQRGLLPVQGSKLIHDKEIILLLCPEKSLRYDLNAAMFLNEIEVCSPLYCALSMNDSDDIEVSSGYPVHYLFQNTYLSLKSDLPSGARRIRSGSSIISWPINTPNLRSKLSRIVYVEKSQSSRLLMTNIDNGIEKMQLIGNCMAGVTTRSIMKEHFELINQIVKSNLRISRIRIPLEQKMKSVDIKMLLT